MDWMDKSILASTIVIIILSCITVYINFQTIRLMKKSGNWSKESSHRNTFSKKHKEDDRSRKNEG